MEAVKPCCLRLCSNYDLHVLCECVYLCVKCREWSIPVKDGCSLDGRQESGPCNLPLRAGWAPSSDDERSMCAHAYTCTYIHHTYGLCMCSHFRASSPDCPLHTAVTHEFGTVESHMLCHRNSHETLPF